MEAMRPWDDTRFRESVAEASQQRDRTGQLIGLLEEAHAAYAECSSRQVAQRRGWLFVELGHAALDDKALPLVLEALETSHEPYLLAAAARALRQATRVDAGFGPPLLRALDALTRRDDFVDLTVWGGVGDDTGKTAMSEAMATLAWLSARTVLDPDFLVRLIDAPGVPPEHQRALQAILVSQEAASDRRHECCTFDARSNQHAWGNRSGAHVSQVRFQNQAGLELAWDDVLVGQVAIVALFYTRCENPLKCSLTVTKLAQVQRLLEAGGIDRQIRVLAISYDAGYDLPQRMHGYATARGLKVGEQCHVLRTIEGWPEVRRFFNSGVNFVGNLVNWHRSELFVLDASGRPVLTYQRLGWQPTQVLEDVSAVLAGRSVADASPASTAAQGASSTTSSVLLLFLALLPKCPICGATYLSAAGIAALPSMMGTARVWPVAVALLTVSIGMSAWMARRTRRWGPLALTVCGAACLVGPGLALGSANAMRFGLALSIAGSLWSVASSSGPDHVLSLAGRLLKRARERLMAVRRHLSSNGSLNDAGQVPRR